MSYATARRRDSNAEINKLYPEDRAVHDWYRFVLSFPPHLVRTYLHRLSVSADERVLDPFCGTGTVLVECKKRGLASVGVEANPMAWFATRTKINWTPDPDALGAHAKKIADVAVAQLDAQGVPDVALLDDYAASARVPLEMLQDEQSSLLLAESISPRPLHKALVLLRNLAALQDPRFDDHERLAFAKAAVFSFSNLHFGPEVGIGPAKPDAAVVSCWLATVRSVCEDLSYAQRLRAATSQVFHADARQIASVLPPQSIEVVITSPPYPNEKDYTRTTRLESVLLGFIRNKSELRQLKAGLVRSNTRGVYRVDNDDTWVAQHPEIQRIANEIEERRQALGKTSGFERMYARVTKLYFGGMARHLAELRSVLRPGARLAYVVGDQASYLRVMIRTGQILATIAEELGYEVIDIDLFRTRLATATREQLREEVVLMRWPGKAKG